MRSRLLPRDARRLAELDVVILAHAVRDQPVDKALVELLKQNEVWYIPTIGVDESAYIYADQPAWMLELFFLHALQSSLRSQFENSAWREGTLANRKLGDSRIAVKMNQRNAATLHRAGVKLGFGANPLRIPGFAEHFNCSVKRGSRRWRPCKSRRQFGRALEARRSRCPGNRQTRRFHHSRRRSDERSASFSVYRLLMTPQQKNEWRRRGIPAPRVDRSCVAPSSPCSAAPPAL